MDILIEWLILTMGIWLAAALLPGMKVSSLGGAVFAAAILGVLNVLLSKLLYVVIGIGTLGLGFVLGFITRAIVNMLLLKLTDALTKKLTIRSWGTAFFAALIISAVGVVASWIG